MVAIMVVITGTLSDSILGFLCGPGVGAQNLIQAVHLGGLVMVHDFADQAGHLPESQTAPQKSLHRYFVGRIEDRGHRPPFFQGPVRQAQGRESLRVYLLESQRADLQKVQRGQL